MNNAMVERKPRPPFGTNVRRFLTIGHHPHLEFRLGTFANHELGPGCYKWNKPQKTVCKVPRWKAQQKAEEFSRRLGFRNDRKLKEIEWMKSINGPGWQDPIFPPSSGSFSFCKAPRFRKIKTSSVPGPGLYGKNHVPWTLKEEKSRSKGFSFSIIPPFEQRSYRSKGLRPDQSYHLPPNCYPVKSAISEFLSKQTSKRGPYNLFTIERFQDPKTLQIPLRAPQIGPSDLSHPSNSFKGKFLICGKESLVTSRLAVTNLSVSRKNPSDPGPGHYDPYPTPVIVQARAPFNSSALDVRPPVRCGFSPSPDRYKIQLKGRIIGDGMKSVFLSKVKRTLPQSEKLSWFE